MLDRDLLLHGQLDRLHRGEVAEQGLDLDHAETDRLLAAAAVGQRLQLGEVVRAEPESGRVGLDRRQQPPAGRGAVEGINNNKLQT